MRRTTSPKTPAGGGKRRIPDGPFLERLLAEHGNRAKFGPLRENWDTSNDIRTEPFPGSIRQYIARVDNSGRNCNGPNIGRDQD